MAGTSVIGDAFCLSQYLFDKKVYSIGESVKKLRSDQEAVLKKISTALASQQTSLTGQTMTSRD
ncbi:hypothetical protein GKC30_05245 [Pseudodesulfovibrio sp. F-1]|uniref:Uncharacterized protein n=1 Tax=Pseudodesulfovibrio alkaliphilus TaxID=2661613 RepID=A0A7K1KLS9_9BACT|nr:hypothetical protein [Pseudodesulfovibrio alkaliphilus]MUM77033.1 hypothetical protein [Pseudodesulfovibrio alkaliphilus]